MFGRGNIEDARALQASFTRAKSPHRKNQNRNRGRGNSEAPRGGVRGTLQQQQQQQQQQHHHHHQQQQQAEHGRGNVAPSRPQPSLRQLAQNQGGVMQAHPARQVRGPVSRPPDSPMSYTHSKPQATNIHITNPRDIPVYIGSESSSNPVKTHTQEVIRGTPASTEGRDGAGSYFPARQISSSSLSSRIVTRQRDALQADDDPMGFGLPISEHRLAATQDGVSQQGASSILEMEDGTAINQPVLQFTNQGRHQQANEADITMTDSGAASSLISNIRAGFEGLSASRWNTGDTQSSNYSQQGYERVCAYDEATIFDLKLTKISSHSHMDHKFGKSLLGTSLNFETIHSRPPVETPWQRMGYLGRSVGIPTQLAILRKLAPRLDRV
ncbi:hypothetical protein AAE478_003643 [Parahypoxylon ruwenzoriense]